MARAQGSLEYLIIIAAAISITAVVTLLVINYFSTTTEQYFYATCREAASTCRTTLFANPNDPCNACDTACKYTNGSEIFPSAVECCKFGEASEIYSGSLGTACVACTSDADCTGGKICCGTGIKRCMTPRCITTTDCPQPACYTVECKDGGKCGAYCKNTPIIPCIEETIISTTITSTPTAVFAVAIGDANNDGKNDVVIGMDNATYELRMYENKTGKWVETNISSLLSGERTGQEDTHTKIYSVDIGDVDNNGMREIVIGAEGGEINTVFRNESGRWIESCPRSSNDYSVAIGNIGGPGNRMVRSDSFAYDSCSVTADSCSCSAIDFSSHQPGRSVAIGDANNDGVNDIVIGTEVSPEYELKSYSSKGWPTNIADLNMLVYSVAVGDANNDGKKEIVAGLSTGVRMYENKSGGWVETNIDELEVSVRSVAIGDADNDNKNEVVVATGFSAEKEVIMYKYEPDLLEWGRIDIADTPTPVYSIAIGDADNDINHRNEIVAGMNGTAQVRMYRIITS